MRASMINLRNLPDWKEFDFQWTIFRGFSSCESPVSPYYSGPKSRIFLGSWEFLEKLVQAKIMDLLLHDNTGTACPIEDTW
jgi:hypothetical protein